MANPHRRIYQHRFSLVVDDAPLIPSVCAWAPAGNGISDEGVGRLAGGLSQNNSIEVVDLSGVCRHLPNLFIFQLYTTTFMPQKLLAFLLHYNDTLKRLKENPFFED